MTGRNRDRRKRRNRKATAWRALHCLECWGVPDYCTDCPCHHQDDEGRDCD